MRVRKSKKRTTRFFYWEKSSLGCTLNMLFSFHKNFVLLVSKFFPCSEVSFLERIHCRFFRRCQETIFFEFQRKLKKQRFLFSRKIESSGDLYELAAGSKFFWEEKRILIYSGIFCQQKSCLETSFWDLISRRTQLGPNSFESSWEANLFF